MLTKSDLSQIKNVVRGEVKSEVGTQLEPIKRGVDSLKKDVGSLKKDVVYLKKKINKIDKTLDAVVKNYDEGDVNLTKRVKRTETHLNLPA